MNTKFTKDEIKETRIRLSNFPQNKGRYISEAEAKEYLAVVSVFK